MGAVQSTQPEETPPPPPPPPPAPSRGWFDWVPGSKARKEAAERRRQEEERLRQEEEERQRRAEFDIIELARKQLEKGVDAARDIDTTDIVEAIKRHTDNAKEKIDEALRACCFSIEFTRKETKLIFRCREQRREHSSSD